MGVESNTSNMNEIIFNVNGVTTTFNAQPTVASAETKTSVETDQVARIFIYNAEDKTYTIDSKTLGSLLHLAEIGDVDTDSVANGSILIYDGDTANWKVWQAETNTTSNAEKMVVVNGDDELQILVPPGVPNQQYLLGWDSGDKLSYFQPTEVASAPVDDANYKYNLYLDPNTKAIVVVKEAVE